jgi:hypothetical protein
MLEARRGGVITPVRIIYVYRAPDRRILLNFVKFIDQQKCSDSVLHEARIVFRHFVTA